MEKKSYTSQEKKKWQKAQEDKLNLVTSRIQESIHHYEKNPDQIVELLAFGSHFTQYDCQNKMLIASQNKHATFVQSYHEWKESGYDVVNTEDKLAILVPVNLTYIQTDPESKEYIPLNSATAEQQDAYHTGNLKGRTYQRFNVRYVYDINQTDCPAKDHSKFYHPGYSNANQQIVAEGLIEYASEEMATDVQMVDLFSPIPTGAQIRLKENDKFSLSPLLQELGQIAIYKNIPAASEVQKELEAICFSIMLENHLGIEVTDNQKQHLADKYNTLQGYNESLLNAGEKDQVVTLEQIINDVYQVYQDEIINIDYYIAQHMEQEKIKARQEKQANTKDDDMKPLFNEEPDNFFDTIAFYITKPEKDLTMVEVPTFYTSFQEAFDEYKGMKKTAHTRLGYFDRRDGSQHDLIQFTDQDNLVKSREKLTSGMDVNNKHDFEILSAVYNLSNHIKEQRSNHLSIMAKETPSFAPTVTILSSEHPLLAEGEILSLPKANLLYKYYDSEQQRQHNPDHFLPYYKTQFEITFRKNEKAETYQGRYNIGDGDGSLLDHIELFAKRSLENPDISPTCREMCQWNLTNFIPYLKDHIDLSDKRSIAKEQLSNHAHNSSPDDIKYHRNVIKYVKRCMSVLNNNPDGTCADFPKEPKRPQQNPSINKAADRITKEQAPKTVPNIAKGIEL